MEYSNYPQDSTHRSGFYPASVRPIIFSAAHEDSYYPIYQHSFYYTEAPQTASLTSQIPVSYPHILPNLSHGHSWHSNATSEACPTSPVHEFHGHAQHNAPWVLLPSPYSNQSAQVSHYPVSSSTKSERMRTNSISRRLNCHRIAYSLRSKSLLLHNRCGGRTLLSPRTHIRRMIAYLALQSRTINPIFKERYILRYLLPNTLLETIPHLALHILLVKTTRQPRGTLVPTP